jgi:outer membrane protein assembly factor BamB
MQSNFYGVISFPVADNQGTVYVGAVDHKVYAINKNGTLKWSYLTGGRISEASPAFDSDGTLYITSADGYLYAFFDSVASGISAMQIDDPGFNLFPNPNNGNFTVTAKKIFDGERIEIYNSIGEMISSKNISAETTAINLENDPAGIYFYRVICNEGIISSGKFAVQ